MLPPAVTVISAKPRWLRVKEEKEVGCRLDPTSNTQAGLTCLRTQFKQEATETNGGSTSFQTQCQRGQKYQEFESLAHIVRPYFNKIKGVGWKDCSVVKSDCFFAEDPSLVLSTHERWFITACNPRSKGSNTFLAFAGKCTYSKGNACTHMFSHAHTKNSKKPRGLGICLSSCKVTGFKHCMHVVHRYTCTTHIIYGIFKKFSFNVYR